MKILLLGLLFLATSGCSDYVEQKQQITYFSEMRENWIKGKLQQCRMESIKITLALYDARASTDHKQWTKEQVVAIEKFILDSCVKHYNLTI